ncbi:TPA: hypothetical protein MAN53_004047 [Klebsiella pneumoniae]|uniref:hypothetical protein n=1 Tax=Klebsiella pneumoniae TaxID=573 RepID=UPI0009BA9425|nr:hypothetical protein [Klebsiella pneumoniae]SLO54146.1 Uncharacterised protein [Klebsiella pneumoniae]HBS6726858.1 hypothetical protein [Klebsiella pneumoniae]
MCKALGRLETTIGNVNEFESAKAYMNGVMNTLTELYVAFDAMDYREDYQSILAKHKKQLVVNEGVYHATV